MNSDDQFFKGFNVGYILTKYMPGMQKLLEAQINPNNSLFEDGLIQGGKESSFERQVNEFAQLRENNRESLERGIWISSLREYYEWANEISDNF